MLESLPSLGSLILFGSFLCFIALTLLGAILKWSGVLLLSWWWVLLPIPVLAVACVLVAGLVTIFSR